MVLRSGIILPFQFRESKKLLMIGVPEENRDLSVWDLRKVVRAAFGVYNFDFRNKKIGFNIPDELLLRYLAQRHDLTNFVIEIEQVIDPSRSNYHALTSSCFPCHSGVVQKHALDLHGRTKLSKHAKNNGDDGNCVIENMKNDPDEGPSPSKLRAININSLSEDSIVQPFTTDKMAIEEVERITNNNVEQNKVEPKIEYDMKSESPPQSLGSSLTSLQSQSILSHTSNDINSENQHTDYRLHYKLQENQLQLKSTEFNERREISSPLPTTTALTLMTMAATSSSICVNDVSNLNSQSDTDNRALHLELELNEREITLERIHEYNIHKQQQQQQHFEQFMQENSSSNNLRQRKERMSKKQKEIYVNFLEQNPIINEHRPNDPALNHYWLKLADILNSVPQGAIKHVTEWKQTFDNWRYRVFLYARYNSKISDDEILNTKCFKPLTMTDKRAYNIWIRNSDTAPPDLEQMRNVFVNLEETPRD